MSCFGQYLGKEKVGRAGGGTVDWGQEQGEAVGLQCLGAIGSQHWSVCVGVTVQGSGWEQRWGGCSPGRLLSLGKGGQMFGGGCHSGGGAGGQGGAMQVWLQVGCPWAGRGAMLL